MSDQEYRFNSSSFAHFLEGAAFKSSQASELLTFLLASVKTTSKADLESQLLLALSSVEDTGHFSATVRQPV